MMKLKDLFENFKDINESPIGDINHMGDISNSTNFTPREKTLMKSDKFEPRLRNAFSKTPFIFDITFLHHDNFDASSTQDNNQIFKHIPKKDSMISSHYKGLENIENNNPNSILFVLTGNLSSDNRISLSPWIIAHKIGHSIEDKIYSAHTSFSYLYDLMSEKYTKDLFNMNSWRIKNKPNQFLDYGEFKVELIAMYLIHGKVSANVENTFGNRFVNANLIEKHIDIINNEITKVFNYCKGKVLAEV